MDVTFLRFVLLQKLLELFLVVGMPARERRPILRNILHRPSHAQMVRGPVHIVVGTKDVKEPAINFSLHEFHHLRRHPSVRVRLVLVKEGLGVVVGLALSEGLGALRLEGDAGIDPAGNQQGGPELSATPVPRRHELVLQSFRIDFEGGFAHVVGQVARRHGDALFGAGVDDDAGLVGGFHARHKGQTAVNGTVGIHLHHAIQRGDIGHGAAAQSDAGVVHEHVTLTGFLKDLLGQQFHGCRVGDIHTLRQHELVLRMERGALDGRLRPRQFGGIDVDQPHMHAGLGKGEGSGAANARTGARHDGRMPRLHQLCQSDHGHSSYRVHV
jgi:hypothetical protein